MRKNNGVGLGLLVRTPGNLSLSEDRFSLDDSIRIFDAPQQAIVFTMPFARELSDESMTEVNGARTTQSTGSGLQDSVDLDLRSVSGMAVCIHGNS